MSSRWYNVTVVLVWVSAMTWLVYRKVLPSMLIGEPPSYADVLAAQREKSPISAWSIRWGSKQENIGWAVSTTKSAPQGVTEVRNRVHLRVRLDDRFPRWLQSGMPERFDVTSLLQFDSLGSLYRFEARLGVDPKQFLLKVSGDIDGPKLLLLIEHGYPTAGAKPDLPQQVELPLPRRALLADTLSPQAELPGLHEGQTWTVQYYSPFRPDNDQTEILEASVEKRVRITHNGQSLEVWQVVYRGDPGTAPLGGGSVRGRLWVRPEGGVVRQELRILGSALTFDRLPESEALALAEKAELLK